MRSAPATLANDIALGDITWYKRVRVHLHFSVARFRLIDSFKKASKISLPYNYNYDHNFQYVVTLKQSSD